MINCYNIRMYSAGMLPWDVIETFKKNVSYRAVEQNKSNCAGGGGG